MLLQQRNCPNCRLADVDLVHANLRDADLSERSCNRPTSDKHASMAQICGRAICNSPTCGASLRGADLRGSRLYGTDLRQADLSGAQLDEGALEQAHWQGARGISQGVRSHAALHNAGVTAAENGQWKRAEALFSAAISAEPDEPLSWVARGLSG